MGRPGERRPEGRPAPARRVILGRRRLLIAAAVAAAIECVAWGLVAGLAWSLRGLMVGVDSPTGIEETRFAVELFGIAGVNLLALLGFALSRMTWGWWLLGAVQVADFGFATLQLVTRDTGWVVFMVPAVLIAILLFVGRRPAA